MCNNHFARDWMKQFVFCHLSYQVHRTLNHRVLFLILSVSVCLLSCAFISLSLSLSLSRSLSPQVQDPHTLRQLALVISMLSLRQPARVMWPSMPSPPTWTLSPGAALLSSRSSQATWKPRTLGTSVRFLLPYQCLSHSTTKNCWAGASAKARVTLIKRFSWNMQWIIFGEWIFIRVGPSLWLLYLLFNRESFFHSEMETVWSSMGNM